MARMPGFRVRTASWPVDAAQMRWIRLTVFVHEQGVPLELEWDAFDAISRHVIAESAQGQVIGTGRLLPDGHIGRMAVLREWRQRGVGSALLESLLGMARDCGLDQVVLNAQTHALGFYAHHGFEPEGEEFLEADIPHRTMRRRMVKG